MIYFVDEDIQYSREFGVPLRMRGHDVENIPDADSAYRILESADNIDLVIVDIMLATGDGSSSEFSANDTDNFLKTGLLLMSFLADKRPSEFPKKFVVLTAAGVRLIQEVNVVCKEMGVTVLKKSDYRDPSSLANDIEGLIKKGLR